MKITHRQYKALSFLLFQHHRYPNMRNFATVHIGVNSTAVLRRLIPLGLVSATKGGPGTRQFFSITDAGRAALAERSEG